MKQKQIEEYEINPCTMFIKPFVYGSKVYSQVYEMDEEFISPFKPLEIIKKSCEYFGSSYEGLKVMGVHKFCTPVSKILYR
ncbi:competence protein ComK [Bacillus sp. B-jedd]|uniref:competence protein ComK n=1 Tax=Bacillus sp. B-jedd TaxID=1476857 RepID=UPI00051572CC|nr:competence protein ComK [Bacillus sp. B-jedd]CEG29605.1 competence transcription factor CTF [Bacillus sp. B-jedd]